MPAQLNHTIVHAKDAGASARFLSELFGLPPPRRFGIFMVVDAANGVSLDFVSTNESFLVQHYAFLVSEAEFDQIFTRIKERGLTYFADPHGQMVGQINRHDGGRGVYFRDPDGHVLEAITRPYGSGA